MRWSRCLLLGEPCSSEAAAALDGIALEAVQKLLEPAGAVVLAQIALALLRQLGKACPLLAHAELERALGQLCSWLDIPATQSSIAAAASILRYTLIL